MDIKPITTHAGYCAALEEIDSLMAAKEGTPEGERLDALANLAVTYEITILGAEHQSRPSWPALAELPEAEADVLQERQTLVPLASRDVL